MDLTLSPASSSLSPTPSPPPAPKARRKLPPSIIVRMPRANSSDDSDEFGESGIVQVSQKKKPKKRNECDMPIFKAAEYNCIHEKLSSAHLKLLCAKYGVKCSGTKSAMVSRARTYCIEAHFASRIQSVFRGHIARTYVQVHMLRQLHTQQACNNEFVNESDFYTMDEFDELPHYQVFVFRDETDNKVYRFNTASFFKLMKGAFDKETLSKAMAGKLCDVPSGAANPYTRTSFSQYTVQMFFNKLLLSRIIRFPVYTDFKEDELTPQQLLDARILELFQDINKLGNYADSDWFSTLTHPQYIRFIQELYDIWAYRADLSLQVKMQICPPYGQIFPSAINGITMIHEMRVAPFSRVRDVCISTCERLVRAGVTSDDRYLGASYVLSALTLVSPRARNALPWLYQSVANGSPVGGAATATYTYVLPVTPNTVTINNLYANMGLGLLNNNDAEIDDAILYNILTMIQSTTTTAATANTGTIYTNTNAAVNLNMNMNVPSGSEEHSDTIEYD
jgi:hypothetical protein